MSKDWTGNGKTAYTIIGASNHTDKEREKHDYYATNPKALELFVPKFNLRHKVWEPSCGQGHLSFWLVQHGYDVLSTDLVDRGYGHGGIDFFSVGKEDLFSSEMGGAKLLHEWAKGDVFDILTNPPYAVALKYVLHALELIPEGGRVILFLKTTFLEGKERKEKLFDINPPRYVYQYSSRIICAMNGEFSKYPSSAIAYGMYVWNKHNDEKKTEVKWI